MAILIRAALSVVVLVGAMLLPFVPGRYDPLAMTLAASATAMGFGSLLLVPVAIAWLILSRTGYAPARTALVTATLVAAFAALAAAAGGSISASIVLFALSLAAIAGLWRHVGIARAARTGLPRTVPIVLIAVPPIVLAGRLTLAEPAAAWARERAIANTGALIADIERFRVRTGAYPVALNSLHPDYHPGIVGVERYRYEPSGQAYNLYFEHPSPTPGLQEIVMYNPDGAQDFSSHAMDLLQLQADDVRRQRGYFTAHDLPQAGWRCFHFD